MLTVSARALRPNTWRRTVLCIASTFALMFGMLGCSKTETPDALIASAKDYATKNNYSAAVIQLKNALQQTPNNGEARLLLGQFLLETRDPASAEKELRRALELKQ